jgi:hypothetical protein
MTTIAEALGIDLGQRRHADAPEYRLTYHAQKQAALKGWSSAQVLEAANRPQHTSPSSRFPASGATSEARSSPSSTRPTTV